MIDPNTLENFAEIPSSGLDNISSLPEITDKEIFDTGQTATENSISNDEPTRKKETVTLNKEAKTTGTKLGNVVGGELGVRLIDIAIPALLVTALHYIGYKLEKERLKFTSEDRKVLAPVLQDAMNAIEIDFNNPFTNLAFVLSLIYATKIIEEIPNITKVSKIKKSFTETIEVKNPMIYEDLQKPEKEKDNGLNLSPETRFRKEWNEVLEKTMKTTGRKSRKGAIGFLYKNEPQLIRDLLNKYNLAEMPEDKDVITVRKASPSVNFEL